jgi:Protein of unknown function (DUF2855)
MPTRQVQARKDHLATTRLVTLPDRALQPGHVRVRVDRVAYTTNNITYAAFGDTMQYWQFFPAAGDDADGWGCIPVWGFGTVVETTHADVRTSERLWGYWPMASHALLQPAHANPCGFVDAAPHRAALHGVYNQYVRCEADALYTADSEAEQALLRPLFMTAWLIDDFLADNNFFGIDGDRGAQGAVLLSSASSKTAVATAQRLAFRARSHAAAHRSALRVGLTSARNVAFCESLGVYDRVLAYEQLDAIESFTPCVYVDFSGDMALRRSIHSRFDRLAYSCVVGATHLDQLGGAGPRGPDLPGPHPAFFFAPAQADKRRGEWGGQELGRRLGEAWHAFRSHVMQPPAPWLVVRRHVGTEGFAQAHAIVLAGQADPREGHVIDVGGLYALSQVRKGVPRRAY